MSIYAAAVTRYLEAWNATDADVLAKAVAGAWTEDGTYTDPLVDVRGHEQIAAVIQGAHEQFPGFEFRLAGDVDGNHHIARFSWELVSTADGSAPVAGSDVVTLTEDGRITSVLGFLDRVPGA
ncbi:nuclear transport factor 2 family protein [Streptomyces sp. SID486]|uniref:nuclear transport factor 2 family protein n=1 Tax=unclassified Streptomyces TaxID=2593676 RepID=UPI001369D3E5|nr:MULTISPECIES: nuclear transport factor 2 family protein [unclassified Streptomyces]MYW18809.1 nuclear transport factor 2 family protein [Streptomyces sp. SID2955]MYW43071.1 nuclear transport factor 2 family protein [Streptomyces sp. SID161]MYW45209.1 nuclear transport factor 2 family protein [Streptomyces sp. SID161]MYX94222.1 nuclear transport factor 2 family protein [Streptomyces sp. SID486]